MSSTALICLDVGEKRIGVSVADVGIRIAVPFTTIEVDGKEIEAIAEIVLKEHADSIVVGYPRNQQGEATSQTEFVEEFTANIKKGVHTLFEVPEVLWLLLPVQLSLTFDVRGLM